MRPLLILFLSINISAFSQGSNCLDFEADTANTRYSILDYDDGDTIMVQGNIFATMYFHEYLDTTGWGNTNPPSTHIWNVNDFAYGPFNENYMWFANTDVEFDLSVIASNSVVSFQLSKDYIDTIDGSWFSINNLALTGNISSSIGVLSNGVDLNFNPDSIGGTVTLTGAITTVRLGGFEFGLDDFCVSPILGLSQNNETEIRIWNDSHKDQNQQLFFELDESGSAEIRIFDALGYERYFTRLNEMSGIQTVELSHLNLSAGIYLIHVSINNTSKSKRVLLR